MIIMIIIIFSVTKLSLEAAYISVYRNLASCEPILLFSFMWIIKLPKLKSLHYFGSCSLNISSCCSDNKVVAKSIEAERFFHCVHWGINPTPLASKIPSPSFLPSILPLNQQTVQSPLFRQSSPYIGFSSAPPKSPIFQWTPKH